METMTRTLFFFDVDLVDRSDEGGQRAVIDPDAVAFTVRNHDLMLFNAQLLHFLFGEGVGLVPEPTKPVTPRTFLMMYHASSDMIILMRT